MEASDFALFLQSVQSTLVSPHCESKDSICHLLLNHSSTKRLLHWKWSVACLSVAPTLHNENLWPVHVPIQLCNLKSMLQKHTLSSLTGRLTDRQNYQLKYGTCGFQTQFISVKWKKVFWLSSTERTGFLSFNLINFSWESPVVVNNQVIYEHLVNLLKFFLQPLCLCFFLCIRFP